MDITMVTDVAKDMMLGMGRHYPTMYVEFEGDTELQYCVLADFMYISETAEKEMALFASGAGLGQAKPGRAIASIAFVNEAWQSSYTDHEDAKNAPPPSEDPNRKEVLFVLMLDMTVTPAKQTGQFLEIIRTGGGIDLLAQSMQGEVHTNFLVAFAAGFRSVKDGPEELYRFICSVTPGQSRQVRRRLLRDLQKLQQRATLMDIDQYKAYAERHSNH